MPDPTQESGLSQGQSLESQPTASEPVQPDDTAEPEGVVEVQGKRLVDVGILAAERKRVREATERQIREKELTPLQARAQRADELERAIMEVRPHIEYLRSHPEVMEPPKPTSAEDQVSDEEALAEARDLELYEAGTGAPDVKRAKRIIARRRGEVTQAARAVAEQVIGPVTQGSAQQASRQNFAVMASQRDADERPLVDAREFANLWAQFPPELTQHPEVGQVLLDAAVGRAARQGKRVSAPARGPILSESAGGRPGAGFQQHELERKMAKAAGMSQKAYESGAKEFVPGAINVIGE